MKKFVVLFCFALIATLGFGQELTPFNKKGKYGYMQGTKKAIPPKYEAAEEFNESLGLAWVKLNGKWGVIDKAGKEVLAPKYDDKFNFSSKTGFAWVMTGTKWGLIDKTGKEIVAPKYDYIYVRNNGTARAKRDKKWGFVDEQGKEMTPFKYDEIRDQLGDPICFVIVDGKWGLFDGEKEITEIKYDNIMPVSFNPLSFQGKLGDRMVPISKTGVESGAGNNKFFTLINDLPYDVYLYICSNSSTKIGKGSGSHSYSCEQSGEVSVVEGASKRFLFKVNKDACGKVFKLSEYMR